MLKYTSLIFLATIGYLYAACPTEQVRHCHEQYNEGNQNTIEKICNATKDLKDCLEPLKVDCAGDVDFANAAVYIGNLKHVCPSIYDDKDAEEMQFKFEFRCFLSIINKVSILGPKCPINEMSGVLFQFTDGSPNMKDMIKEGVDISHMCSFTDQLIRRYMWPMYVGSCSWNNLYNVMMQTLRMVESFCLQRQLISNDVNIGNRNSKGNTTENPCLKRVTKCARVLNQSSSTPAGSLDKGFYFSKSYLNRVCRQGKKVLDCYHNAEILDDPQCSEYGERVRNEMSLWQEYCTGKGFQDLSSLLPCLNKKNLQVEIYGYGNRLAGALDAASECNTNMTVATCQRLPSTASNIVGAVNTTCGNDMSTIFECFIKKATIVTISLAHVCPEFDEWINETSC